MAGGGRTDDTGIEPAMPGIDEHCLTDVSTRRRKAQACAILEASEQRMQDRNRRLDLHGGNIRLHHALSRRVHDAVKNEGDNDHKRQC